MRYRIWQLCIDGGKVPLQQGERQALSGGKAGTFGVKVPLLQVNGRTVLLLAAAAANIDGGRC